VRAERTRIAIWRARQAARDVGRYLRGDTSTRAALEREYFFQLARRYTPTVRTDGEFPYHVATRDRVVGREAFVYGSFDLGAMRRAFAELPIDVTGRTVIDIGANIGTSTVELILRYDAAHVVAVEADPDNYRLLRLNVIENGIEDRVTTLNLALSDRPGTLTMRRSDANWGDHRIAADGDVQVSAATLDQLVEDGTVDLDAAALVWMDVQGHEAHVLAGASRLLAAGVPIITEYWPAGIGEQLPALERLIAEHFETVIDLGHPDREEAPRRLSAGDIGNVGPRYRGDMFADLILLP
jgi:FkbM family methyltransferase